MCSNISLWCQYKFLWYLITLNIFLCVFIPSICPLHFNVCYILSRFFIVLVFTVNFWDIFTILIWVLQRSTTNRIYKDLQKEICYEGLAYTIMESEESCDEMTVTWRPREGSGRVLVQTLGPENHKDQWCKPEGRRRQTSQLKQDSKFVLLLLFCSMQALSLLDDTHLHW